VGTFELEIASRNPPAPMPEPVLVARARVAYDHVLRVIAPRVAYRNARARIALDELRSYEANSVGRRMQGWRTPATDANEAARGGIERIRNRTRDLYRNDAWARRGVRVMTSNVVGTGLVLRLLDEEGKPAKGAVADEARKRWARWANTTACDSEGQKNFYGLQKLAVRTAMLSGEVIGRRRWRRREDGLPVPLQLQVLEPDHLDSTQDGEYGTAGDAKLMRVLGVQFDAIGRREGYWMFRQHPGAGARADFRSILVPASEIMHVYPVERPGQVRGVSPLAVCVVLIRDAGEFVDATMVRQKIAAMHAGFIHDIEMPDTIGGGSPGGTKKKGADGKTIDTFEPGMLEVLPPGKTITFNNPPTPDGFESYMRDTRRGIAIALDVTYEQLTGDYSGVNFTSGRMGWLETARAIDEWRWDVLVPMFCDQAWQWFVAAALLEGRDYSNLYPLWTPPRREMLDPVKETAARVKAVRAGFVALSDVHVENGDDSVQVLETLAGDLQRARELGLKLECDPTNDATQKADDTTGDTEDGSRPPKEE